MKKKCIFQMMVGGLYLFTFSALAQEMYYCANTSAYIAFGSSEAEVERACGIPTSKEKRKEASTLSQPVEQYFYEISQVASRIENYLRGEGETDEEDTPNNNFGKLLLDNSQASPNVRISLIFTVADDQVIDIQLGGQTVESTSLCSEFQQIKLNGPVSDIINECGDPAFVNYTTQTHRVGINEVTLWNYDYGQYQYHPPATFKFVDGVLIDITS